MLKASVSIITGSPLRDPMATLSHGDPAGNIPQDLSLHELQQILDWVNVRVDQPQAWLWAYVEVEHINPNHWGYPSQVRDGASYPMPMIPVSILPGPRCGDGGGGKATSPECWGRDWYRSSIWVRTSSLAVMSYNIQGQLSHGQWRVGPLSRALWVNQNWSLWPPEMTGATDISTDPNCSRGTDPDMFLGRTWIWIPPLSQVAV